MNDQAHAPLPRARGRRLAVRCIWIISLSFSVLYLAPRALGGVITLWVNGIEGESSVVGHEDEIDALSVFWSGGREVTFSEFGPLIGTEDLSVLTIAKFTDRSSPEFISRMMTGTPIDQGTIFFNNLTFPPTEFLKIDFEDTYVTRFQAQGDGDFETIEEIDLSFDYIEITYTEFVPNGGTPSNEGGTTVYYTRSTMEGGSDIIPSPNNTPPTISTIPDTVINEDGSILINFTVADTQSAPSSLTLGRSSSNTALLPLSNIVFGGSDGARNVTLTPLPNQSGTSSVGITVSDGTEMTTSTFLFTVDPVNDPPTIAPIASQVTESDTPLNLSVTLSDLDSPINALTLTGTADPAALVTSITDTTGTGSVRNLQIIPAPGSPGITTITLTAHDGSDPGNTSFNLSINLPAGSGPASIQRDGNPASTPITLEENSPNSTDLGTLSVVDNPGLSHTFTLLDDAGGRFGIGGGSSDQLIVANSALLDFEGSPTHTIMVQATDTADPGRTRTDTFTIDLLNVNEPPSITLPLTFGPAPPDTDFELSGLSLADPDAGLANLTATFAVNDGILTIDESGDLAGKVTGNGSPALTVTASLTDLNAVLASTGLIYRSSAAFTGDDPFTVDVTDNGASGLGGPETTNAASTIEVALTLWEAWRQLKFSPAELLNPAISSFSADPDQDGLPNGGEYTINSDPKNATSGPDLVTLSMVNQGGFDFPAFTFPRRISDPDLSVTMEVATNLQNFDTVNSQEFSTEPIDADFELHTIRSTIPSETAPTQQFRLGFSRSPDGP